jgi:type I restriction enzyme, S subunit
VNWNEVELREVSTYAKTKIGVNYITSDNYISTDNMVAEKGGITSSKYVPTEGKVLGYNQGDVLVSNIRPYFRKIWKARKSGGCSNDILVFSPVGNKVSPDFLYYQLSQDKFFDFMMAGSNGIKMPRGNRNLIPTFKVSLPPLPVQKKIARILSAYDDLIENNLKQIKLLEEMTHITYEKWFVRLRFPGHETIPISPETSLPEGWENAKLKKALTFYNGKVKPSENTGSYLVYGANGVIGVAKDYLFENAIVIGRVGAYCGALTYTRDRFWATDNTIVVKAMEGYQIGYLSCLLGAIDLNWFAGGSAQPLLTHGWIKAIPVTLAPSHLQEHFEAFVNPCFIESANLTKQNKRLSEARDILLPRLMTGMIDVDQYNPADLLKEAV